MKLSYLWSSLLLSLLLTTLNAQESQYFEHLIDSQVFEGERKIRVFLPDRYLQDTSERYAVTYVLDAQSDAFWNMAKSNINYLVRQYQILPMIVVGIVSENRGSEFAPPSSELKAHFRQEVFPLIEENYRVHTFRSIVGHSWGGAFVGHTLFSKDRDLFAAYLGISPSLDAYDYLIVHQADSLFQEGTTFQNYFYCSAGDIGIREMESQQAIAKMDSLLQRNRQETLVWQTQTFAETDHWSCVIPSFNAGLVQMSRNYFADQKILTDLAAKEPENLRAAITAFYQQQEQRFGFTYQPKVKYLNFVANDFRDQDNYAAALPLYQWALEQEPDQVKVWVNVADLYDKTQQQALAKAAFQKVLNLLDLQKEALSERYYNNISKWAQEKLATYD